MPGSGVAFAVAPYRGRYDPAAARGLLRVGLGGRFWINVLPTIPGYVPGIIRVVWGISRYG